MLSAVLCIGSFIFIFLACRLRLCAKPMLPLSASFDSFLCSERLPFSGSVAVTAGPGLCLYCVLPVLVLTTFPSLSFATVTPAARP